MSTGLKGRDVAPRSFLAPKADHACSGDTLLVGLVFEDAEGKGDALPLAVCCVSVQEHPLHQYNCRRFSAGAGEEPFGLVVYTGTLHLP